MMKARIAAIFISLFFLFQAHAQRKEIYGRWKTIDDASGKAKSIIEIYDYKGKAYGKVIKLFREPGEVQDPICEKCSKTDPRYMKKVIGMDVITAMEKNGDTWEGKVMDPENGQIYSGSIWLEGGKLKVRGYLAFFYRTQEWIPVE